MIEEPPDYAVGYKMPPLHGRFQKGRSGNPAGRRPSWAEPQRLPALLKAALDGRPPSPRGRGRPPATSRAAIVAALIGKCIGGDLRAVRLVIDLMQKTEFAHLPEAELGREDPRETLIRMVDQLAAEEAEKAAKETLL